MTITHQNCCEAAKSFSNVWSIDTKSVSIGVAILILEACRMRDENKTAAEIYDAIEQMKSNVKVGFVIDSVNYLHKGGRCSALQAMGANFFNLHPAINMLGGKLNPGKKYRGNMANVYTNFTRDFFSDTGLQIKNNRVILANTSYEDNMNNAIINSLREVRSDVEEIIATQPGCSICVHCGPNTVGFAFMQEG
jgi:DegV family protein with EDD domain